MTWFKNYNVHLIFGSIILIVSLLSCADNQNLSDTHVPIKSLVDSFDKAWLNSDRERLVFHDPVTKKKHVGDDWFFDSDVSETRFPWPRFTPNGGSIFIEWKNRMERRMIIKLLNIGSSYPKNFLRVSLNDQPLPVLEDHLPTGEYEFYIPSSLQLSGTNRIFLSIDKTQLPTDFQYNSIGLHSIRVTLGAVVRNAIQIGDQVRKSLLFAPPVKLHIPYSSPKKQFLQFSYGLYSTTNESYDFSYSLKISLLDEPDSRPVFERVFPIFRNEQTQTQWQSIKQKLPALPHEGILEVSFYTDDELTGPIDYLALSEAMIIPANQTWALKTETSEPDILFVSLSSVSADQLGVYGNPDARTPFLDRFAQSSWVYTDMTAASNGEISSLISMVTGKLPRDHGVYRDTVSPRKFPSTFTDLFADTSYQSSGFALTSPEVQSEFSKISGFKRIYLSNRETDSIEDVRQQLTSMLSTPYFIARPGFYWFHLSPEISNPESRVGLFNLESYYPEPIPIQNLNLPLSEQERLLKLSSQSNPIGDMRILLAQNDQRLSMLDQSIHNIVLDIMKARQQREISMILTSDHGVIRSVNSNILSTDSLSQEVLHSPLLWGVIHNNLQNPVEGTLMASPISATKIYEMMSNLIRKGDINGGAINGILPTTIRPIFAEHETRPIVAFRRDNYKLIHCLSNPYFQIGTTNLFNLEDDPAETINLVGRDPDFTQQLLDPVMAFCRGSPFYPGPRLGLEDEALAILQSLKYTAQ